MAGLGTPRTGGGLNLPNGAGVPRQGGLRGRANLNATAADVPALSALPARATSNAGISRQFGDGSAVRVQRVASFETFTFPDGSRRQVNVNDPDAVAAAQAQGGFPINPNEVGVFERTVGPDGVHHNTALGSPVPIPEPAPSSIGFGDLTKQAFSPEGVELASEAAGKKLQSVFGAPRLGDVNLEPVQVPGVGGATPTLGGGSPLGRGSSLPGSGLAIPGGVAVGGGQTGRTPRLDTALLDAGTAAQEEARGRQIEGLGLLRDAALGNVPSAAEIQGRRQINQAIANQFALAGGQRGIAGALARRDALSNAARLTADASGQAAALRAQETATARGQLAEALGAARGQDIDAAGLGLRAGEAQLGADTELATANLGAATELAIADTDARLREFGIQTDLLTSREKNQLLAQLQAQELQLEAAKVRAGLSSENRRQIIGGLGTSAQIAERLFKD